MSRILLYLCAALALALACAVTVAATQYARAAKLGAEVSTLKTERARLLTDIGFQNMKVELLRAQVDDWLRERERVARDNRRAVEAAQERAEAAERQAEDYQRRLAGIRDCAVLDMAICPAALGY